MTSWRETIVHHKVQRWKKKLPEKQQVHLQIKDCMQFWWKLETDLSKMNIGVNFQTI